MLPPFNVLHVCSIFSYEELDVVDPDADAAAKGAAGQGQHAGVHQEVCVYDEELASARERTARSCWLVHTEPWNA